MYRPSVLSGTRVAAFALLVVLGSVLVAQPARAVTIDPTSQEVQLDDDEGVAFDKFGWSVAVSGNTAIVGAINRGAAYIFVRNGAKWDLQQKLPADDAPSESFGQSVAISGNTAVVGATATDGQGAAYVYQRVGTQWVEQDTLSASDGAAGDQFGYAVAISGDTVVVGAPYRNAQRGAAYVFVRSGGTWVQPEQHHVSRTPAHLPRRADDRDRDAACRRASGRRSVRRNVPFRTR